MVLLNPANYDLDMFYDKIARKGSQDALWMGTINPFHYDMTKKRMLFNEFSFVLATTSESFYQSMRFMLESLRTSCQELTAHGPDARLMFQREAADHMDDLLKLRLVTTGENLENIVKLITVYYFLAENAAHHSARILWTQRNYVDLNETRVYMISVGAATKQKKVHHAFFDLARKHPTYAQRFSYVHSYVYTKGVISPPPAPRMGRKQSLFRKRR